MDVQSQHSSTSALVSLVREFSPAQWEKLSDGLLSVPLRHWSTTVQRFGSEGIRTTIACSVEERGLEQIAAKFCKTEKVGSEGIVWEGIVSLKDQQSIRFDDQPLLAEKIFGALRPGLIDDKSWSSQLSGLRVVIQEDIRKHAGAMRLLEDALTTNVKCWRTIPKVQRYEDARMYLDSLRSNDVEGDSFEITKIHRAREYRRGSTENDLEVVAVILAAVIQSDIHENGFPYRTAIVYTRSGKDYYAMHFDHDSGSEMYSRLKLYFRERFPAARNKNELHTE